MTEMIDGRDEIELNSTRVVCCQRVIPPEAIQKPAWRRFIGDLPEAHFWPAHVFPPSTMMFAYVQSPLGNSEHGENRRNESHTGYAEGRVE
jgi:hypothetical protein